MSGYSVSSSLGRIQTGEMDSLWEPRRPLKSKRGVILCHGAGNPHGYLDATNNSASLVLATAIADAGFYCVSGDMGGDTWGNDTFVSCVAGARTLLASTGCATDKVLLVGGSMGAACAIRYAQANPTQVAALVGVIPLVDPNDLYVNNRGGYQASVGTAWGITYPTALPTRGQLSLAANEALFTGPQLLYYSTADLIVIPSTVTAYAAATGAQAIICDTTAGHSNAAIAACPPADIAKFLGQYA